ncbi:hypothetical protein GCM10027416_32430 [Okibacterium endophyticum]
MDRTPTAGKNYEILPITGDAYAIERRGIEIESLGDQMTAAADLLDTISLGAECRGKSLDSIKDSVGDVAKDLRTAGERYSPSGGHITSYARALDDAQARLNTLLPALEELWTTYRTTAGQQADDAMLPPAEGEPDEDLTTAADVDEDRDAWKAKAVEYEGVYDTWWAAYEDARRGIQGANDRGVEDSWWDDQLPWLEVLGDILSYAGIALAIVACILGGPFILIAAIVGLAALAVAVWKVSCGRGNGWDIAMAAIGVFPFGKAFSAFSAVRGAAAGTRLTALGNGLLGMGSDIVGAGWRNGAHLTGVLRAGRVGEVFHSPQVLNQNGTRVMREFFNDIGNPSMLSRLLLGREGAASAAISDAASGLSNRAVDNLTGFLSGQGAGGSIMQDMLSGGNQALDFLDGLGKAGAGFGFDRATGGWGIG